MKEATNFFPDTKYQIQIEELQEVALNDLFINENSNGITTYSINLTQATIYGLEQPAIRVDSLKDEVTYNYETLNITGNYGQDGIFLLLFPVYGSGGFHIEAKNITITSTGDGNENMFFYVDSFVATFQDYLGGGLMTIIAKQLEPILAAQVFHYFQPNIQDILNGIITIYSG